MTNDGPTARADRLGRRRTTPLVGARTGLLELPTPATDTESQRAPLESEGPADVTAEVRRVLGISGRFELAKLSSTIRGESSWYALVAAALLMIGPWTLAVLPILIGSDIVHSTGSGLGPTGISRVVGAGLGTLALAKLLEHEVLRQRIAVASSALAAVSLVVLAMSEQPPGFVSLVGGGLLALSMGSLLSLVADHHAPAARVRVTGLVLAGGMLGLASAALSVAVGSGLGWSWRGSTLAVAMVVVVATVAGTRLPDAPFGGRDEVRARALVRTISGDGVHAGDEGDPVTPPLQALRILFASRSVRPVAALAAASGLLLGPMLEAVRLLLRDRWVVVVNSRTLAIGVLLLFVTVAFTMTRRGELLWRASPVRYFHHVVWTVVFGAISFALGSVMPATALAFFPLALGFMACGYALLGSVVSLFAVTTARSRPLAGATAAVAMTIGSVAGDIVVSTFGSRFGPAWGGLALSALLLTIASVAAREMEALHVDTEARTSRLIDSERLASARRLGHEVPLLACRNVDFSYGQLQVLFDVTFSVDDGEMVALLGTNGAGKSTLLRVVSGLGTPTRGSVVLSGADITHMPSDVRVNEGITQIPGGKAVFGSMSVVENLRVYGYSLGRATSKIDDGIDQTLDAFPVLAERRNQLASTLSGGEQQMLALGKAFILQPRLLLIDELSLGLAPKIVGELLQMVQRINRSGTAIVLVEQSVNIALSLVDHAYFMEKGEMRFDGVADDLLERPDLLRSVFLAEVDEVGRRSDSPSDGTA